MRVYIALFQTTLSLFQGNFSQTPTIQGFFGKNHESNRIKNQMKDLSCYFAGGDSTASLIELLMKRKFFSMSMILTDPEQWSDAYDLAAVKQRYEMLMEVFNQPLSPQLIQDVDLGTIVRFV